MWRLKGLVCPAALDAVPALMVGAKGRAAAEAGQALPLGPEPTLKLAVGWASGVPGDDQGTRSEVVWKLPQLVGLASGARAPSLRETVMWLAGSCGFWVTSVVSWPVFGSAVAIAGSLKLTP